MTKVQEFRISQLVLTYGPGSLIETMAGPRLLPLPEYGLFDSFDPEKYAIQTPHLTKILGNRRIFGIPSNADLGRKSSEAVYKTKPFPHWKLCIDHGYLYSRRCPKCEQSGQKRNTRIETIRFLQACSAGHIDEFPWTFLVHSKKGTSGKCPSTGMYGDTFRWDNRGGSLAEVKITCEKCNASATLADAYERDWLCRGRFPEREALESTSGSRAEGTSRTCDRRAKIMQRQATSLRLPEVLTALTIPPLETQEHLVLSRPTVKSSLLTAFAMLGLWDDTNEILTQDPSIAEMERALKLLVSARSNVTVGEQAYLLERLAVDPVEFISKVKEAYTHRPVDDMKMLIRDEFRALVEGAANGIPSSRRNTRGRTLLEINPHQVRDIELPGSDRLLRVAPVSRLHSVTVQRGYRRAVTSSADSQPLGDFVSVESSYGGSYWYPGYESTGEGIFISLAENTWHPQMAGSEADRWLSAWKQTDDASAPFEDLGRDTLHPVFVWWHTLSHMILRTLSIDSGYSLASIRERVFLETEADGERAKGGILLYTSGYGADASLGGLIALVPRFERILRRALGMAETCSADPLCSEHRFAPGRHGGAACYACSLISETSCAHRNFWLDRNLFIDEAL